MEAIEFILNGNKVSITINEITDYLLKEANKFKDSALMDYTSTFREEDFKYRNKTDKIDFVRKAFADLKSSALNLKTWTDHAEIRTDLAIAVEKSIDIIDNKKVLLERWNKMLVDFALFLLVIHPKKEYLVRMLDDLNREDTTIDEPDYLKLSVEEILKTIFKAYTVNQLKPVATYITIDGVGLNSVPNLVYTGLKTTLWKNFNQIVSKGYDRYKIVLFVSEKVAWRKKEFMTPQKLDFNDVGKRIFATPPNMG
jgi:hypothetical protein